MQEASVLVTTVTGRTKAVVAVLAAAGVAVAVISWLRAPSTGGRAAAPASRETLPADAPPWPAEADRSLRPQTAHGEDCEAPRVGGHIIDPGRGWPFTLDALLAQTRGVAIVVAESQRSYWSRPAPGAPLTPDGVFPVTTTNFRVERVLRGSLPAVVQVDQLGARRDGTFVCSGFAYGYDNDPLPEPGRRYVVFLEEALGGGRFRSRYGSAARLEIRDGVVYSLRTLDPRADVSIVMDPEPLERFTARFG